MVHCVEPCWDLYIFVNLGNKKKVRERKQAREVGILKIIMTVVFLSNRMNEQIVDILHNYLLSFYLHKPTHTHLTLTQRLAACWLF